MTSFFSFASDMAIPVFLSVAKNFLISFEMEQAYKILSTKYFFSNVTDMKSIKYCYFINLFPYLFIL